MLGTEMLMKTLFSALGIKGDEVVQTVTGIAGTIQNAQAQLDRIEAKQNAIMAHFEIAEIVPPHEGTKLRIVHNGEGQ